MSPTQNLDEKTKRSTRLVPRRLPAYIANNNTTLKSFGALRNIENIKLLARPVVAQQKVLCRKKRMEAPTALV
jgi:hypothetical protein